MTCPRRLAWLPVLVAGLSLILAASGGSFRPLAAAPFNPAPQDAGTLRQQARAALAQTSDDLSVAGLEQPVEVIRDRWGIPHIYARSEHDLFFAQGFVAAQDRLWQLDLWRRIDEGKLSELLGPAGPRSGAGTALARMRLPRRSLPASTPRSISSSRSPRSCRSNSSSPAAGPTTGRPRSWSVGWPATS